MSFPLWMASWARLRPLRYYRGLRPPRWPPAKCGPAALGREGRAGSPGRWNPPPRSITLIPHPTESLRPALGTTHDPPREAFACSLALRLVRGPASTAERRRFGRREAARDLHQSHGFAAGPSRPRLGLGR